MKKTRILALLLAMVMLLCATACGGDTDKKDNGTETEEKKSNNKGNSSTADSLYNLAEEAEALIADGNYEAAYLMLQNAPLPEGDWVSADDYTTITSLLDKFVFVPVYARVYLSEMDDSTYTFDYDEDDRLVRIVEEYKDLDEHIGSFVPRTRVTTLEHSVDGDCTDIIRGGEVIYSYTYDYDRHGRLVGKVEGNHEYGESVTTYTYTYADEGYLQVEHKSYDNEGEDEDYAHEYVYNADGSLHSTESTYPANAYKTIYTYNDAGYIVREDTSYGEDVSGYTIYDENGKFLTEVQSVDGYSLSTTATYDSHGNMVQLDRKEEYNGQNHTTSQVFSYTYDENGKVLSYTDEQGDTYTCTYDTSGNLVSKMFENWKWVYNYDTEGNLVKIQLFSNGTLDQSATLDKFGNILTYSDNEQHATWSYRLVYYPDGVPECVKFGEREGFGHFETWWLFK